MTTDTKDYRPEMDERLASATNSSTLAPTRIDDRGGAIGPLEVLAAAGWTSKTVGYLIGRTIMALESEWDGSEQPRAPREHDIEAIARSLPERVEIEMVDGFGQSVLDENGKLKMKAVSRKVAARLIAERWYETERVRLIGRLKALPPARAALALWAQGAGLAKPEGLALAMLAWWLDHRCPKCFGTKLTPAPLGGRGAVRVCGGDGGCAGTGERQLPFDDLRTQAGRIMERHIIECRRRAIQKIQSFTGYRTT